MRFRGCPASIFAGVLACAAASCAPAAPAATEGPAPDVTTGTAGTVGTARPASSDAPPTALSSGAQTAPPSPGTAGPATGSPPAASGTSTPPASPGAAPPPIPPNTVVLHVGDSFLLAGFAQALKPRMKALGVRYEIRSEQSSYTTSWAGKMERLVKDTQPDLVIINLGANEVSNTDPPTHAPAVRRIVKGVGGRPCVWVSPPLWRKDTGIINVIRENSAPCRFFDSDMLVPQPIPRISDKIHPTPAGGAIWATAFWDWLHEQRVPLGTSGATGNGGGSAPAGARQNPWLLKPGPSEEHLPRDWQPR